MTLSPRVRTVLAIAFMFLPILGYTLGDWLIAHWAIAKQLDEALKPYAFSGAMLIGLLIGLAQTGWIYWRKREWSSYTLQQLGMLLVYTLIPLHFGHYVGKDWSIFGLVGLGVAAFYAVDAAFQAPLFVGFARHFSPESAERLNHPRARRIVVHIEIGFVVVQTIQNAFILLGNHYLPKALYLLVLPFYAKVLWGGFMAFAFTYPRWTLKRYQARQAIAPEPTLSTAEPAAG